MSVVIPPQIFRAFMNNNRPVYKIFMNFNLFALIYCSFDLHITCQYLKMDIYGSISSLLKRFTYILMPCFLRDIMLLKYITDRFLLGRFDNMPILSSFDLNRKN